MRYVCCDERRLRAVKEAGVLNGIESLEVSDSEAPPGLRQRTLFVRLLQGTAGLATPNVVVEGGERIPVEVEWALPATPLPSGESPALTAGLDEPADVLLVRTDSTGDYSPYTLRLVAGAGSRQPPAGFDPLLTSVEFSFKVECPSDFDCAPVCECPPEPAASPEIDYLAKDFQSFRSLMLDRLSLLAPEWRERSSADLGIALVELLAYLADELSYRQDAAATEAYLATARLRTSLRRHARLVDYVVHEGANARAWVRVFVAAEGVPLPAATPVLTRAPELPSVVVPGGPEHRAAIAAGAETFETVADAVLYESHERFDFWTWGDAGCCLPRGATSATLAGDQPELKAGDVLVLAEVAGPRTGQAADADPAKRVAVRLTHVVPASDPSGGRFDDPPTNAAVPVTEITWDEEDALPFPLCVSAEEFPGLIVSEAWGNVVLADHGRTIPAEPLGAVPEPVLYAPAKDPCDPCEHDPPQPVPIRFRPGLAAAPVTHARAAPTREVAEGPTTASLTSDLASLTFSSELHDWLEERGFRFRAGAAVVRGGDGAWSVSDGVTVALLLLDAGTLTALARPSSASATALSDPRAARPRVTLAGTLDGVTEPWSPQLDLLGSGADAPEFVVEVEHDGAARLRFGDGVHGRRPETGTEFEATYRVGNGTAGNVGAGAIAHAATSATGIVRVTNPLPAVGGVDPEPAEAVRRDAPEAYLIQQRAVTEADYAEVSERHPRVQRAAATFRWTGSWHTVFVTADRVGGSAVDDPFEADLVRHLNPFRMAGYDLEVDGPRFVPLDVGIHLCVQPEYFRVHVKAAVLDVLSSGVRSDGTLGFFHPDRFTFGQPVYLSAIVAAAQGVPGVQSVVAKTFRRQREDASSALDTGVLEMQRLEVARLDNDRTFPEHGVLALTAGGGK
ncbi:MAG TPA: putative baseplate assembly protein [Gaiellaceae bacterium]|nr:putative baseplate assembly protein [Gaiellaceae bacterium]